MTLTQNVVIFQPENNFAKKKDIHNQKIVVMVEEGKGSLDGSIQK